MSDQRQQLPLGAFLPRPPRGQAIAKPCKFVRREAHLLKRGVQGDAQELKAACRQNQLLRHEGDTEVAAEVLESLQVAGARSMGSPRQKIIIKVMEDAAAPANVYGNPVKRLRELSKNEGGRAGPKRQPEVDVYPLFLRVAQERPIRTPHRAEAEGVAFAINAFLPKLRTMATAASTEVYGTADSSREMPELTKAPLGEDKSKPRRTEPSEFQIVYWPDHLIRHFRCRTQPRKPERRDHWVRHGERDSRHGGHRSGESARGRPGAIIAPCSGRSGAARARQWKEKPTNLSAISCFELAPCLA